MCDIKNNAWVTVSNECIILFLTRYFIYTIPLKTLPIADFAIVAKDGLFWLSIVTSPQLICDVTRTWSTVIVTSYSSIVLARENCRKGDLHWWITTVNIDFSQPGIHGLACKKWSFCGLKHINVPFGTIAVNDRTEVCRTVLCRDRSGCVNP